MKWLSDEQLNEAINFHTKNNGSLVQLAILMELKLGRAVVEASRVEHPGTIKLPTTCDLCNARLTYDSARDEAEQKGGKNVD